MHLMDVFLILAALGFSMRPLHGLIRLLRNKSGNEMT